MQISRFLTGGFVIHKIPNGLGKASAWFDESGQLLDVEAVNRIGRQSRPSRELRDRCSRLGKVYSGSPAKLPEPSGVAQANH